MPSIITRGAQRDTLERVITGAVRELWIVCPFIQLSTAEWIRNRLASRPEGLALRVLTTPPLDQPANDPRAVLLLADLPGCEVRCLRPLHAKIYLADRAFALVTSANLSRSALDTIYECGVLLGAGDDIDGIARYVSSMWPEAHVPSRDVLVELAASYLPGAREFWCSDSDMLVLDQQRSRRAECRYLAERSAFELVRAWHADRSQTSGEDVMQFARHLNKDLRDGLDRVTFDRFGPQVVNINARQWAQEAPLFSHWCVEMVLGNPEGAFQAFFERGAQRPTGMKMGTVSALLYLRRHGEPKREPQFCFYNSNFVQSVEAIVEHVGTPSWSEYLDYCERCRKTLSSSGLPVELWDLALSEMPG